MRYTPEHWDVWRAAANDVDSALVVVAALTFVPDVVSEGERLWARMAPALRLERELKGRLALLPPLVDYSGTPAAWSAGAIRAVLGAFRHVFLLPVTPETAASAFDAGSKGESESLSGRLIVLPYDAPYETLYATVIRAWSRANG
ncbi:MAG: hypothetical protein IMW86_06085 [Hydrogenibacillus sp.]|nr:hypothetical protein [Hydrogenibacillus sp.]